MHFHGVNPNKIITGSQTRLKLLGSLGFVTVAQVTEQGLIQFLLITVASVILKPKTAQQILAANAYSSVSLKSLTEKHLTLVNSTVHVLQDSGDSSGWTELD